MADEKIRIDRVIKRDGLTLTEIQNKLDNQLTDNQRTAASDFLIINEKEKPFI